MKSKQPATSRNPFSKRGQCGKNALPKQGLTPTEERRVQTYIANNNERWKQLFALNKWKPQQDNR